jgi:hypothetical protein
MAVNMSCFDDVGSFAHLAFCLGVSIVLGVLECILC